MCYNLQEWRCIMFRARQELNPNYFLYYVVTDENGDQLATGGLNRSYTVVKESGAYPYTDVVLRATVNRIMDGPFDIISADRSFGFDLKPFGFTETKSGYTANREDLRLPHCCDEK